MTSGVHVRKGPPGGPKADPCSQPDGISRGFRPSQVTANSDAAADVVPEQKQYCRGPHGSLGYMENSPRVPRET